MIRNQKWQKRQNNDRQNNTQKTKEYPQKSNNKKQKKNYHTPGEVPKSNRKMGERGKIDTLTHKCMATHFPVLVQALQ